jgi:hypothetical protein
MFKRKYETGKDNLARATLALIVAMLGRGQSLEVTVAAPEN